MRVSILILWLVACSLNAATYYVRTDGNNGNSGTSNTAGGAWATITYAGTQTSAGDVVRVQAGSYTERPSETTAGSSGSPITYIADGSVVIYGGFQITGNYVRLIGFEITQSDNLSRGYAAVYCNGARGVQIIDNYIHHTSVECVDFRGCPDIVIRGNNIGYSAYAYYPWAAGTGNALIWGGVSASTNVMIEYNQLNYGDDFINNNYVASWWTIRNNRFGPTASESGAHLDNFQPNSATTFALMENNWDEGANCTDHHFNFYEVDGHRWMIIRGNVILSANGSANFGSTDDSAIYNNTWYGNNAVYGTTDFNVRNWTVTGVPDGNMAYNNLFCASAKPAGGAVYLSNGTMTNDYNLSYGQPVNVGGQNGSHSLTSNPLLVNTNSANMHLQSGSPARNASGPIVSANGAGVSSTALTVTGNAYWLWPGDGILIGSTAATISSINSSTSITLVAAVSWSNGDAVRVAAYASDIGALPYGSSDLSAATISNFGTTYTVTTTGDARGVWFYVDGVPTTWDSSAPYQATIASGTVTAKAYALYAQSTPVVSATSGGSQSYKASHTGKLNIGGKGSF